VSLGEAVVDVGADTSGFESQLDKGVKRAASKAESALSKVGRGTTKAGRNFSVGLTAPLLAIAGQAVKTQATFEQNMNLIRANLDGLSAAGQKSLGDLAIKLGKDTVFSANEASAAMLELAKGGFKQAQIAGGGIQATLALAATEGLDLADAATITGNAMNAFGLKAKDAAAIADALAAGSSASSASVASLAEGLGNVGPIAKQSGLSLQDTVAALAELDQNSIKGAEGGTALRSFLTRLVPTGKKAKDAIAALGLSFKDADGNFRSLGDISGQLQDKLGGLSDAQRAEALQTIFGTYAKQAAAVFLESGAKGYAKFRGEVEKTGTAQKLADARMSGTTGAIEKMQGSVETASLALGTALAPTVTKVAGKVADLANWFSNLDEGTQQTIAVLGGVAAALGPVLYLTGKTITTVQTLTGVWGKFAGSMSTAEGKGIALARAVQGLAGAAGLYLLTKSMVEADESTRTLEGTLGGAATGFALGGPIGGAIGALAGFTMTLANTTDTAADKWKKARDEAFAFGKTLDGVTAKITKETDAQVLSALTKQTAAIPAAQALGLSQRTLVKYVEGNAKAQEKVNTAIQIGAKSGIQMTYANGGMARASDVLTKALGDQRIETGKGTKAVDGIATSFKKQHDAALANAAMMAKYKGALKDLPKDVTTRLLDDDTTNVRLGELETLIDRYHKTPKEVRTLVKLSGQDVTQSEMRALISYSKQLGQQSPTVKVDADTKAANAKIQELINGIARIKDKTVTITTYTNANVAEALTGGRKKKKRAGGGPVNANDTYLVGEIGPELFVPSTSGRIISNQQTKGLGKHPFSGEPIKRLNKLLDQNKQKVQDLSSAYDNIASSVSDAFKPDLFSGGLGALIGGETKALGTLPGVLAAVQKLIGENVSPSFLQQLIASGNTKLITALASGSLGQAQTAGTNFDRIQALTGQIGATTAAASPEAKQLAQVNRELQMIRKELAKHPDATGKATSKALDRTATGAKRRKRRPHA
jgi:TP901 family phage tail tape measure protein